MPKKFFYQNYLEKSTITYARIKNRLKIVAALKDRMKIKIAISLSYLKIPKPFLRFRSKQNKTLMSPNFKMRSYLCYDQE